MKTRIYLLPGIMCNEQLWIKLIPCFDDSYEFVHLEIPHKPTVDEIVEALNEEIKEESIHLLGFSLGGYIASYFACRYPHRIKKLCVIGATVCDLPQSETLKRQETIGFVKKHGFKGLSRQKVVSLLAPSNEKNNDLISLIQEMYVNLGKDVFLMQLRATLKRKNLMTPLVNLDKPCYFIYSNQDRLVNQDWMSQFKQQAPSITFYDFNSTSHMLPLEKPEELAKVVRGYFH